MDKELGDMLIAKQIKPTAIRTIVLVYLLKQKFATLSDLEKEFSNSDKVTLYGTLKTFNQQGIVHTISINAETTRYALCETKSTLGTHSDLQVHFIVQAAKPCCACRKHYYRILHCS